jgi:hypothetical protein
MKTKIILVAAAFSVGAAALQIPGLLRQMHGARLNANLIDIGISVVGCAACVVVALIKQGRARNSGQ